MRYLLGPNLVCLRLTSPSPDLWTGTMCSLFSWLSRHSLRLEVLELHATSPEVAELALCGLPHLQRVSLTLRSNKALSYITRLIGLHELYITVPTPCGGSNFQFSSSSLHKAIIHSSTLTSVGKIVEGWVVQCKSLWLLYGNPATALAVDPLEHVVIHGPKSVDHDDYTFHLRTFTPLACFSHLKEILLPSFCMSWLDDDALSTIVKSWPRLVRLDLGPAHFWQTTKY
ncbi:hypothetical protein BDR05DRAFT_1003455 [Suillus weaverae]|nr:hypothetical protein BDR05DRAFT_1003455 [Suillus weaverae]